MNTVFIRDYFLVLTCYVEFKPFLAVAGRVHRPGREGGAAVDGAVVRGGRVEGEGRLDLANGEDRFHQRDAGEV